MRPAPANSPTNRADYRLALWGETPVKPMKRRMSVLLGVVAVAAMTAPVVDAASTADTWTPRPAIYGVAVQKDVMITMSDGAELDAEIHLPATTDGQPAPGRFPVLLVQTPYNH